MNNPSNQLTACAVLLAVCALPIANAANADQERWTVVGADRLDVAVLRGESPVFILRHNLTGPDWKGGRLEALATVRPGNVRAYEQEKIGFYVNWYDKQPMKGRFDLRYELRQTAPDTVTARSVCRPELATKFGMPGKRGEQTISIGLRLPPTPYFKGGTGRMTFANGQTAETPLPMPYGSHQAVAAVALATTSGETTRLR